MISKQSTQATISARINLLNYRHFIKAESSLSATQLLLGFSSLSLSAKYLPYYPGSQTLLFTNNSVLKQKRSTKFACVHKLHTGWHTTTALFLHANPNTLLFLKGVRQIKFGNQVTTVRYFFNQGSCCTLSPVLSPSYWAKNCNRKVFVGNPRP